MRKLISVIIPIYNTENELAQCLSSICNQTYRELEIICVDDGSTDKSGEILDDFASRDSRIIAIHQKNMGESAARNIGLSRASGDVIAFCDCDDWIEHDMYEILLNQMNEFDLDFVASSWIKEEHEMTTTIKNQLDVNVGVFGRDELLKYIYMRDSYRGFAYMWNKLYARELFYVVTDLVVTFPEDLRLGGDVIVLAKLASRAKRIKYVDKAFYHYLQRATSGCHTTDLSKYRDWITAYEQVLELFGQEKVDSEVVNYVKRFMAYHCSNAVEIAIETNHPMKKDFQKIMDEYKEEYLSLNEKWPERIERYNKLMRG